MVQVGHHNTHLIPAQLMVYAIKTKSIMILVVIKGIAAMVGQQEVGVLRMILINLNRILIIVKS